MTGGLTKPAAESRAHKATQGAPVCDAGRARRMLYQHGGARGCPPGARLREAKEAQVRESGYAAHYVEYKNISQPWREGFFITKNNTLYEDYTKITEKLLENDKSTQKNIAIQNKRRYTVLKRV